MPPPGLLNAGANPKDPEEGAEIAALRELEEETGYKASLEDVIECSSSIVCDPGQCHLFSSGLSRSWEGHLDAYWFCL
jgi:8-oxo-dGTP pyrophosphatase MutT (NUDIX family)